MHLLYMNMNHLSSEMHGRGRKSDSGVSVAVCSGHAFGKSCGSGNAPIDKPGKMCYNGEVSGSCMRYRAVQIAEGRM